MALGFALSVSSSAGMIRATSFSGAQAISSAELEKGSYLASGSAYSDSLLSLEIGRIDSLYFSRGRLAVEIEVDTVVSENGIDVRFAIRENEATRIGRLSISGAEFIGEKEAIRRIRPGQGDQFDPFGLERSLAMLLQLCNESGYPFAQVWLTGFTYRKEMNEVDIAISIAEGERARISHVAFDGITKTDSAVALRISRLKPGSTYRENRIVAAREYLRMSGYFEAIGDARIERRAGGAVDVIIPVKEIARDNLFQGALGFSRKDQGDYVLNGAVELELRNIAGKGRNVHFDWLNKGEQYSNLGLRFKEPFLFSTPVSLEAELSQVIQDSVYLWHSGGLYIGFPLGPGTTLIGGAAADRNVPNAGELVRSIRERFRLGFVRERSSAFGLAVRVEGAHRKSYLTGNRSERDGQLLYRFESDTSVPAFGDHSVFLRLVSEAIFSTGNVPLAEMFPLGGAKSLRGYRESQFRGERIAFANLEYRLGEGGWIFLFDDVGAFWRRPDGWILKNGAGFGLRAESPLGVVALSFGVGERFSLEGTLIHISLAEKF
jgi:outer membrane protein assembly factor BamA